MESVGIAEAKRDISTLVNRVAFGGERIILTSRGKPKAALISIEDLRRFEDLEKADTRTTWEKRKTALAQAQALREAILARRNGVPFPDSVEDLRQLREERDSELSGLR
ncbi:MAG: type II toxin-antitoxin system Phd/YefM family antitoxin [Anaerolineae bacterium]